MRSRIKKAIVLGAGAMGSSIAAHLANVGIQSDLLDIVPDDLLEEERRGGLTRQSPAVRNRLATQAREALLRTQPAPLYTPEAANLITAGNIEDHFDRLREADWIIEAMVERLEVKREVLRRVGAVRRPGVIVSSVTSGISINKLAAGQPDEFRQHFLGTHCFYPVRYMRLMEVIPGRDTLPEVLNFMVDFGQRIMGKSVLLAKDTPLFIANRISVYDMFSAFRIAEEESMTVEEVDAITGPIMGRPQSAIFHTADLIGLDILLETFKNLNTAADNGGREVLTLPAYVAGMMARKWLGNKTEQGFYRKAASNHGEMMVLDFPTMEYRPRREPKFPSLILTSLASDLPSRLKALAYAPDQGGRFAWKQLKKTLLYAAAMIPEIADEIVSVDRAMKWGYNWDLGPFETWDAIGLPESVVRMEKEGERIPPLVEKLLAAGYSSFYQEKKDGVCYFDLRTGGYKDLPSLPEAIFLPDLKDRQRVVKSNPGASLVDIGDGVACLEFHSPCNAIDNDVIAMLHFSLEEVRRNFIGLVIGNNGLNFSPGFDLLPILRMAQDENWSNLELVVRKFQEMMTALKYSPQPVVAAPFQRTLMRGCEVALAAGKIQAAAETYLGLVEVLVGLLPSGGGVKEMLLRAMEGIPVPPGFGIPQHTDALPCIAKVFENIVRARVSTSAGDARRLGFLRASDGITANPDRLIFEAKQVVIRLARNEYQAPLKSWLKATGNWGYTYMMQVARQLKEGGHISEYDVVIAASLARVLTGGDAAAGSLVSEQYILDLERESILGLLGDPRTRHRIQYMLDTGQPLRN